MKAVKDVTADGNVKGLVDTVHTAFCASEKDMDGAMKAVRGAILVAAVTLADQCARALALEATKKVTDARDASDALNYMCKVIREVYLQAIAHADDEVKRVANLADALYVYSRAVVDMIEETGKMDAHNVHVRRIIEHHVSILRAMKNVIVANDDVKRIVDAVGAAFSASVKDIGEAMEAIKKTIPIIYVANQLYVVAEKANMNAHDKIKQVAWIAGALIECVQVVALVIKAAKKKDAGDINMGRELEDIAEIIVAMNHVTDVDDDDNEAVIENAMKRVMDAVSVAFSVTVNDVDEAMEVMILSAAAMNFPAFLCEYVLLHRVIIAVIVLSIV